jgi:NADPH-dependent 7-cyano-7-deazaguanine reductase QueF
MKPKWLEVTGEFSTRGGIHSTIVASYEKDEDELPTSDRVEVKMLEKSEPC